MPFFPKPQACEGCPAFNQGRSFVRSSGPTDAQIVLLGQGPGEMEAYQGYPFVGPSGTRLDSWLHKALIKRYRVHIDNIVKCWLPGNRAPTQAEVSFCRQAHWQKELDALPWRVLVPVGVPAAKAFIGKRAGLNSAGHVIPWEEVDAQAQIQPKDPPSSGRADRETLREAPQGVEQSDVDAGRSEGPSVQQQTGGLQHPAANGDLPQLAEGPRFLIPILHPAYIQRGQFAQEPAQILYLKRARHISETRHWPTPTPGQAPPGSILYPTPQEMIEWEKDLWEPDSQGYFQTQGCTVDIENAANLITIIGLCRVKDLVPIVVRFRKKGGDLYWNRLSDLRAVVTWLYGLLSNAAIPKVFHNGQAHDITLLEQTGFKVVNYSFDTMLAQHIAYPELPKRLEFIANLYAGLAGWKAQLGEDDGEGK